MERISVKKSICFKSISLLILLFVIFISFLLTYSMSKYVSKENAKYQGKSEIDFTVNSVFVVDTAEELFAAINQGYSYVQLDKSIENPLIITQKAENLNNDLILDLNGIEIQRNGYEPILNINEGTRLTIVDSSDEQTGGLYNPVGSVFNINGGVLTVVTGFFESGPRYSEYYTYNNFILNSDATSTTKRTIVEINAEDVMFFDEKNPEGTSKKAPIIKSYPTKTGDIEYNHGNLYFDEEVKKTTDGLTIKADTYCYYRTSEDASFTESNTSMADWYYTYYVKPDTYNYVGVKPENNDDIEVTIYGYENVIEKVSEITNKEDYYAAIQMSSGELDVQEGAFYQYFGVDTTACVNASGGTININYGTFSSRVPDSTEYYKNKVSVKESDKYAFDSEYFKNFYWFNSNNNSKAKYGESYCILNSGDAVVEIDKGKFYSSNNNIISMHGGNLLIKGGSFYKKITNNLDLNVSNPDDKRTYLSAINMEAGTLNVENSELDISGNNTYAIYMEAGTLNVGNSKFDISGNSTYAIYSTIANSNIGGKENFVVNNSDFEIKGENATGIYSSNGQVVMKADKAAVVNIKGKSGKGVFVENGGSVVSTNYSYYLSDETSYGLYSLSGTISMESGNIYLSSNNNCYGIYAASETDLINITVNNSTIAIGCLLDGENKIVFDNGIPKFVPSVKSGTVSASVGVFLSSKNNDSILNIKASNIYCDEIGLVSNGGTIELENKGKIYTNKASAIAIRNGNITFNKNSDYTIVSSNTTTNGCKNTYNLTLTVLENGKKNDIDYVNTDGIYVNGGSFTSYGNLNITHTGLKNDTTASGYYYNSLVVTSYAVRVYGGDVTIKKGTITANIGGGIYSGKSEINEKGKVVLGVENQGEQSVKVYTLGKMVSNNEYDALGKIVDGLNNWKSYKSITGGHAVELDGGSITIHNGYYEAQFGNGIFVNGSNSNDDTGEIIVYDGEFYGYMHAYKEDNTEITGLNEKSGPAAYYGLKVIGGSVVKIYGGYFGGGNGGAFVTGVTKTNGQNIEKYSTANVYIYAGKFGSTTASQDAFNVYDSVNIVFGAYTRDEIDEKKLDENKLKELIVLEGISASVAANGITYSNQSKVESNILIYYGSYIASDQSKVNMYLDPKFSCKWTTYNTKLEYTYCYGKTIINEKNNTEKNWFSENFN